MLSQIFYIKSIDEVDTINLPPGEIQARMIAKNVSIVPTFIVYALFLPLLMILHYCHQPTQNLVHSLIFSSLVKPTRWICYKIVFSFCNLLRKIN